MLFVTVAEYFTLAYVMRNRSGIYFTLFLGAVLSFLMLDYSLRKEYITKLSRPNISTESAEVKTQQVEDALASRSQFRERFSNFVIKMHNSSNEEPETSEQWIKDFSLSINDQNLSVLNDILVDYKNSHTERSLALELMISKQNFISHNFLNTFAQSDNFGSDFDFELALRAQAIEGVTLFSDKKLVRKNLENLKIRTNHAFLYERAVQGLLYLNGEGIGSPYTEDIDAKANKR